MKKNIFTYLIALFTFSLALPTFAFAATTSTSSSQTSISDSDEFLVNVSISASVADGTQYYLRGEFFKPATSNYCGLTWNGSTYFGGPYTGTGFTSLIPITVTGGVWSGQLKAKFDASSSACNTSGAYNFRVLRYTTGGSTNDDSQTPLTVTVSIGATPTATPSSTPTASPTETPTSTPTSTPEPTPTASPTPTDTPEPTVTPTPSLTPSPTPTDTPSPSMTPSPSPTSTPEVDGWHNWHDNRWDWDDDHRLPFRFSDFHFRNYNCHVEYVKVKHRWFVAWLPSLVCGRDR